jgi:hypothetical protein
MNSYEFLFFRKKRELYGCMIDTLFKFLNDMISIILCKIKYYKFKNLSNITSFKIYKFHVI